MSKPRPPPPRRAPAFLIIPVFLLVALAAVCVAAISVSLAASLRETENRLAGAAARSAVLAGTRLALADLQIYAGTDDCATAEFGEAAHGGCRGEWLGAWHGARILREFPDSGVAPLVSNRGDFAGTPPCVFSVPTREAETTEVPWETLGENARVAFFIRDESLRASIAKRERDAHLERFRDDAETLARLRQQIPRKTRLDSFFEETDTDAPEFREKIAAAPDEKIFLAETADILPNKRRAAAETALAREALGVPADWTRRQLKTDLADEKKRRRVPGTLPAGRAENFPRRRARTPGRGNARRDRAAETRGNARMVRTSVPARRRA